MTRDIIERGRGKLSVARRLSRHIIQVAPAAPIVSCVAMATIVNKRDRATTGGVANQQLIDDGSEQAFLTFYIVIFIHRDEVE